MTTKKLKTPDYTRKAVKAYNDRFERINVNLDIIIQNMDNINVVKVSNVQKKQIYLLKKKINALKIVNSIIYINFNITENV